MPNTGRLEKIWIKRFKSGPMDDVQNATLIEDLGIEGNANQGGRRQVTVISAERWAAVTAGLSAEIDPSGRRANLMISGIELEGSRGRLLHIGSCTIELLGETRPCNLMDEIFPGLRDALKPKWGGGAFGIVETAGEIRTGDRVVLEPEAQS